jgi:UDP-3-O-[3-hydroxymyristoyl] glucosamine N-acyltransferase
MLEILAGMLRFFGMYSPLQSMRTAMYRKAGIHVGKVSEFGGSIWLSINYRNLINIEDDVILAGYVTILSHSFLFARARGPKDYYNEKDGFFPVIIKKRARIGMHVVILPGVTIGENSIIGACAVVTNDIPPNCVAVGVPAKPVRYFNPVAAISDKCVARDRKMPSNHQMLYVKCKTCEIEFCSMIRCDKQIFRILDLRDNRHPCPNGHKNRYNKKDYYYRD